MRISTLLLLFFIWLAIDLSWASVRVGSNFLIHELNCLRSRASSHILSFIMYRSSSEVMLFCLTISQIKASGLAASSYNCTPHSLTSNLLSRFVSRYLNNRSNSAAVNSTPLCLVISSQNLYLDRYCLPPASLSNATSALSPARCIQFHIHLRPSISKLPSGIFHE